MLVSASGFDERNSFARRGAPTLGDPFDLVFVSGDTAHQPARNEQCAYNASTPAVVQIGFADKAALALPIQKRDGALIDLVDPPTHRQTELGTLIPLLFGVCQLHSASRPVAIICLRLTTNLDLERNLVVRETRYQTKQGPKDSTPCSRSLRRKRTTASRLVLRAIPVLGLAGGPAIFASGDDRLGIQAVGDHWSSKRPEPEVTPSLGSARVRSELGPP